MLPWLQELRRTADSSLAVKRDLADLCKNILALESGGRYGFYSWMTREEDKPGKRQLLHEVAIGTLQCEEFDLYDRAAAKITDPMPPEAFHQMGTTMALTTAEAAIRPR